MSRLPEMLSAAAAWVLFLAALPAPAADWPGWRGIDGSGVSAETGLPARWSATENLRWKVELPGRGLSSPVISRGRVYLTASSGVAQGRLHVLGIDASTGRRLWERQLWATGDTQCHPKTCMAAPTPASDGARVYALFATLDLAAFDEAGGLVWYRSLSRDYPTLSNQVGMAASPVLRDDLLVLDLGTDSDSFVVAIDAVSGTNRWKVPRRKGINWTTPLVLRKGGAAEVLIQSSRELTAYDLRSGERRWMHAAELDAIASPVAGGDAVFLPGGDIAAIRPSGKDEPPLVLWKAQKLRTSTASPLYYEGRVYAINSAGILACAEGGTGTVLWQERLKGPFSASPVAGDGKLYCVNEEGVTAVVDLRSEKDRVIATNPLGETILASPAVSGGVIYFRSDRHLYAIGPGGSAADG